MFFIVSRLRLTQQVLNRFEPQAPLQIRNYAARKGTRERKQKKKVQKTVVEKVGFIPHNQRNKAAMLAQRPTLKFDDSWKRFPIDNVYPTRYYQLPVYSFAEAVQNHRETHHPSMYNAPSSPLVARIELNMQGEKKTRFVDDFNRIVDIPHPFDHGEDRSLLAFAKTAVVQKEALDGGAHLAGGSELIKQIQNGDVSLQNFNHIIAHPDILPELVALRGLMKRKFPNPRNGSLDVDLATVTRRFLHGINYIGKKDEYEKDFGLVEVVIGSLDMEASALEGNFGALINDLSLLKPKRSGEFIRRCLLLSAPSSEKFKIGFEGYIVDKNPVLSAEEVDDEEEGERVAL